MRRTFLGFVIKFTGVSSSSRPRERTVPSPFFLYSFSSFLSHARARCDQSVRTLSPPSLLRPSVASPPLPSLPPPPGRQVRKTGHPAFVPLFLSSNCAPLFFSNRKCRFFGRPGGTRQGWRCRLEEEEEEEEEEEGGLAAEKAWRGAKVHKVRGRRKRGLPSSFFHSQMQLFPPTT